MRKNIFILTLSIFSFLMLYGCSSKESDIIDIKKETDISNKDDAILRVAELVAGYKKRLVSPIIPAYKYLAQFKDMIYFFSLFKSQKK